MFSLVVVGFVMRWGLMLFLGHATQISKALQNQWKAMKTRLSTQCCWDRVLFHIVVMSLTPIRLVLVERIKIIKIIDKQSFKTTQLLLGAGLKNLKP